MLLFSEAKVIPAISSFAAQQYEAKQSQLRQYVGDVLQQRGDIKQLIGHNEMNVMYDNHRYHVRFMSTVFQLNSFELLSRVVVWAYRAYPAHGFLYDYFPVALNAWKAAVCSNLTVIAAAEINTVYDWLISKHTEFITVAESKDYNVFPELTEWQTRQSDFLSHLILGEYKNCLMQAEDYVKTAEDLKAFYLEVVQPCMYKIGSMWEKNEISIVQEHLATAIVARIMLAQYLRLPSVVPTNGKAVIMTAPNEFHEIGSRMVADLLEFNGWQVYYLGTNTPANELIELVRSVRPTLLGIGVVIPSNLVSTRTIIERIKQDSELCHTNIVIGGAVFLLDNTIGDYIGADRVAYNCQDVLSFAETLQKGTES